MTATIYPCDRPKNQHFTLVTELITTLPLWQNIGPQPLISYFTLVTAQKSVFFTLVTCKFSTFTLVTKIGPPPSLRALFLEKPNWNGVFTLTLIWIVLHITVHPSQTNLNQFGVEKLVYHWSTKLNFRIQTISRVQICEDRAKLLDLKINIKGQFD